MNVIEISFAKMTINVDLVGHNSLIGALCERFLQNDYMKHIGSLNPEQIIFVIKRVQPEVNMYEEMNKVRDILKIDEKKLTLLIRS